MWVPLGDSQGVGNAGFLWGGSREDSVSSPFRASQLRSLVSAPSLPPSATSALLILSSPIDAPPSPTTTEKDSPLLRIRVTSLGSSGKSRIISPIQNPSLNHIWKSPFHHVRGHIHGSQGLLWTSRRGGNVPAALDSLDSSPQNIHHSRRRKTSWRWTCPSAWNALSHLSDSYGDLQGWIPQSSPRWSPPWFPQAERGTPPALWKDPSVWHLSLESSACASHSSLQAT